ncbi:hypothetical protein BC332_21843 [Capsicum chinense]|nr:hypothetical protein BC332_21843 [Capsicum chinense]
MKGCSVFDLCCPKESGRKKKNHPTVSTQNVTGGAAPPPLPSQANRNVEKCDIKPKNSTTMKDGGMVVLRAAAGIVTSAPVNTSGGGGHSSSRTSGGGGGGQIRS